MILHAVFQQIWKIHQCPQAWERSVLIPVPKKGNAKNIPTTIHLCSFHVLARLCPRSFKRGFSSIWTEDFQMYKLGLEKAEKPEIKLSTLVGSCRKQGSSKKSSTSASLTILLYWLLYWLFCFLWLCGSQQTMKILKEMGLSDHLTCLLRKLTQVKKQQLELLLYNKTIYCHPAYLTYMQSTSCKMLSWMMHKLKLPGKIPTASGMLMLNTLNGRKQRGTKETLDESE